MSYRYYCYFHCYRMKSCPTNCCAMSRNCCLKSCSRKMNCPTNCCCANNLNYPRSYCCVRNRSCCLKNCSRKMNCPMNCSDGYIRYYRMNLMKRLKCYYLSVHGCTVAANCC